MMVSFNDRLSITLFIRFGHISDGLLEKSQRLRNSRMSALLNVLEPQLNDNVMVSSEAIEKCP